MNIGERFSPHRQFSGLTWVPDVIMEATWLKAADKLVLGRLMRAARAKGWCWPSQIRLAGWCGLSRKQVRTSIGRLLAARLLAVDVSTGRTSNGYHFLWHRVFEEAQPALQGTQLALQGTQLAPQGATKRFKSVKKRQAELPFGLKPPASECGDCNGTGWRESDVKGIPAVTRCGCIAKGD